jgi:hypothetical protein
MPYVLGLSRYMFLQQWLEADERGREKLAFTMKGALSK